MASFDYCIDQAVKGAKINKSVAQQIKDAQDPEAMVRELAANYSRIKREKLIDAVRLSVNMQKIQSHPDGPLAGLQSLLSRDNKAKAKYSNVDMQSKVYEQRFLGEFGDALSVFRTRMFGLSQNEEGLNKFIKALYGEAVGDAQIEKFAKDWLKLVENMRVTFNEKGGSISKNENWLLPQHHDMQRIVKADEKEWIGYISDRLDRSKMLDDEGKMLDDEQLEQALKYVYQTITTGGMNKAKGLTIPRGLGRKLSRKGSEERFLYFKDAESWISYNNKFGKGDVLTTLTDHITARANDIALVETLGTNPKIMFDTLMNQAKQLGTVSEKGEALAQATFNVVSGAINGGNLTTLADGVQGVRNLMVASKLGKAFLASFTDLATSALTASYNGISATKVLKRQLKMYASATEEDKKALARMGLVFDTWAGRAHSANRFADTYGTGGTAKVAEIVLRGSGLEWWTESGRKAFSMEFAGMLSDNFGKSFDDLDSVMKRGFDTYGISKEDWDAFRTSKKIKIQGAEFADLTADASMKFHRMVLTEADFAVPTPDARVRAIMTGGTERGSFWGQIARSATMLKSFPATVVNTHLYRGFTQVSGRERVQYLGGLIGATTLMGAFAIQVKDLAAGREPRPINADFWKTAVVQGGGLGPFADFVISDVNQYGQGFVMTVAGPMASFANDTFNLTLGNLSQVIKGEETNILGEGAKYVKNITPNTWYTQAITNSMFDTFREWGDPTYAKSLRQIQKRRMKEYGQGYWWAPGESVLEVIEK